ncbi:MAG TPA: 3-isopropylmalate dehydratase small subunit [Acidimicrobiia bacterium]|nr:3-isopropylmalate dehydratase small subunit [Acidimicrobiia bacterium]
MNPLDIIRGTLAPLPRADIDTDQIMPKEFLKRVERTGYGQFLFHDWRRTEPKFVLDRPEYREASILVTGANFGSGSSREHAPWGLADWGFRAIIAPSFADIFRNNCFKIGLLPVELEEKEVAWLVELAEGDPTAMVVIDLDPQTVTADGFEARFEIDPYTKWRLQNGFDDIGLTLQHTGEIDEFERTRPGYRPTLT